MSQMVLRQLARMFVYSPYLNSHFFKIYFPSKTLFVMGPRFLMTHGALDLDYGRLTSIVSERETFEKFHTIFKFSEL